MVKEFVTAVREAEEVDEEEGRLEFAIDGTDVVAYRPSEAQFAMLMLAASRHTEKNEAVAGAIDFFYACLDEDSAAYVYQRLINRKDAFGLTEVENIIEWMVEEWTGRPFPRSSGSTSSRPASGRGSSRRTTKSTS